ncbi:hypothetical protein DLAC_02799 [Tieghemostelium lacteum]|uniref:Uncharacterized protein n=1 Tax=Tieghemostelium lacteum TaxID=361077 RepID=A0A152A3F4_TIELA|nr:hypothetical protein DLAC_02799 [Tieghemostelium lacteum]|eukprot:KYR00756.1 hypothetical protein DLAC_02799 [Tieghemostelium lacteum]
MQEGLNNLLPNLVTQSTEISITESLIETKELVETNSIECSGLAFLAVIVMVGVAATNMCISSGKKIKSHMQRKFKDNIRKKNTIHWLVFNKNDTPDQRKEKWDSFNAIIDEFFPDNSSYYKTIAKDVVSNPYDYHSATNSEGDLDTPFFDQHIWEGSFSEYIIGSYEVSGGVAAYFIYYKADVQLFIPTFTRWFGNEKAYVNSTFNSMGETIDELITKELFVNGANDETVNNVLDKTACRFKIRGYGN